MKVGDRVTWTSSSHGSCTKKKTGEIIAVVPQDGDPGSYCAELIRSQMFGGGSYRSHESYVVLVGTNLYWPRVKWLKLAEGE